MTLQFSLAAFTGMAVAMIAPRVRHALPRWLEALIWLGLILTCWLAITDNHEVTTRRLTESAAWGADQIVKTSIGLVLAAAREAVLMWLGEHRYAIANAVITLAGTDILALAMVRSWRQSQGWHPRIALGDWFEVPLERVPAPAPVEVPYALDEWNRRAERASARLGTALLSKLVQMMTSLNAQPVSDAEMINIDLLLSMQSMGWYGPIVLAPERRGSIA
jgi:hypothetical protein